MSTRNFPGQVLLHPELTDSPAEVLWRITSFPRDLSMVVSHPNSPLLDLVNRNVLHAISGGVGTISTEAVSQDVWRDIAGEVRRAVEDTVLLAQERQESQETTGDAQLDSLLRDVAPLVLDEHVRPLAGAHGGTIEITKISHGTVWVYLAGACRGCPAAQFTLQQRFQRELERQAPGVIVKEDRNRKTGSF